MDSAYKLGKLNIEYTKAVMELNREIDRLRAENEKLRNALRQVSEWDIRWAEGIDSNVEWIKSIVETALCGEGA